MKWIAITTLAVGSLIATDVPQHDTAVEFKRVPTNLTPPAGHVVFVQSCASSRSR